MPPKGSGRKNSGSARNSRARHWLPNNRASAALCALARKLHIAMPLQEPKIANVIEVAPAGFHFSEMNHLRQIPFAVAPIQCDDDPLIPCARWITLPLILRKVVERQCA